MDEEELETKITQNRKIQETQESSTIENYENYFHRNELNSKEMLDRYDPKPFVPENIFVQTSHFCRKYYKPSKGCMKNFILDRLPFLRWLANYDVKEALAKDILAGLTVGVIQIPQGIMAGLPAITGLYVSFWPVLVYAFFGTSQHLSIGTTAITSIMISSCLQRLEGKYFPSASALANNQTLTNNASKCRMFINIYILCNKYFD